MTATLAPRAEARSVRRRIRSRVLAGALSCAGLLLLIAAGAGMGATQLSSSVIVDASVNDTISITDPAAADAAPAPTNGSTWTSGTPDVVNLGALNATDSATIAATWTVSTTAAAGYTLQLANTSPSAPLLTSGGNTFPDMCTAGGPGCPGAINMGTSAFGVAIGDAVNHNQASVPASWGTTGGGGTQGTLYAGVPVGGMLIATSATNVNNDPVTINFAAVSAASTQPAPGNYSGTMRLSATSL